mmetsp:Transcript_81161/g.233248  ORF Transcript_81161/g.233248 Transcript_81161/m.233248 type:complete len:254 (-) Transcript_81161:440-1201(-)
MTSPPVGVPLDLSGGAEAHEGVALLEILQRRALRGVRHGQVPEEMHGHRRGRATQDAAVEVLLRLDKLHARAIGVEVRPVGSRRMRKSLITKSTCPGHLQQRKGGAHGTSEVGLQREVAQAFGEGIEHLVAHVNEREQEKGDNEDDRHNHPAVEAARSVPSLDGGVDAEGSDRQRDVEQQVKNPEVAHGRRGALEHGDVCSRCSGVRYIFLHRSMHRRGDDHGHVTFAQDLQPQLQKPHVSHSGQHDHTLVRS